MSFSSSAPYSLASSPPTTSPYVSAQTCTESVTPKILPYPLKPLFDLASGSVKSTYSPPKSSSTKYKPMRSPGGVDRTPRTYIRPHPASGFSSPCDTPSIRYKPAFPGCVDHTPRTDIGACPASEFSSYHVDSPKRRTMQPPLTEAFAVSASPRIVPRPTFPSAEDYIVAQTQKAFNAARIARGQILRDERCSLRRLGEGFMQVKALEDGVTEARSRLKLTDHHIAVLLQELFLKGVVIDEDGAWAYATSDHFRSPYIHAHSVSIFGDGSSTSSTSQEPCNARCDILQESIVKRDVYQWSRATLPGDGSGSPSPAREMSPIGVKDEGSITW